MATRAPTFCRSLVVAIGDLRFPGEPSGWQTHVKDCRRCRELVEAYELTKKVMRRAGVESSADDVARHVGRIRHVERGRGD